LSASAAQKASEEPIALMKGKRKLTKLRNIFLELYGKRFEILPQAGLPIDKGLQSIAVKYFRVV